MQDPFRTPFSEDIARNKYLHAPCDTWDGLSRVLAEEVMGGLDDDAAVAAFAELHSAMKVVAGGRYLYYAGRPRNFYSNCYILKSEEDTREDWAYTSWKAESCLMTGGGIGNDYSAYRPKGSPLKSTGGAASGAVSKMRMINEIGREVMQGAGRRSALLASLGWRHGDVREFLRAKDWFAMKAGDATLGDLKTIDPNFPCPLDMTNISVNYDNAFLEEIAPGALARHAAGVRRADRHDVASLPPVFVQNVEQALRTGEPGMCFNMYDKEDETGRNACGEVVSADDSDVCNLASVNMSRIETLEEFAAAVEAACRFLVCGGVRGELPYEKVREARTRNRRIGCGLMGVHEWLMMRGYRYECVPELKEWLEVWRGVSESAADALSDRLGLNRPKGYRAIAPTGTIGLVAGTTTGIEPLFAVAYERRYIRNGTDWERQYVVDGTARSLIDKYDLDPDDVECAIDLAKEPERRIRFQADVNDYCDMGISSTINLPGWGTRYNNENSVMKFAETLAGYAHRLRGFTCYPDGARGNQPLTSVDFAAASAKEGTVFRERHHDICELSGKGGACGA